MLKGNLLEEKIITIRSGGSVRGVTLPEILSALGHGEEIEFTALRPHQQHPWHAFLVQLGALVVYRSGQSELRRSEQEWRGGLLELAGKSREDVWQLVVEDLGKPAFMQTPIPEGSLEDARYNSLAETPDEIDTLITAKNHDVKQARMYQARLEHWMYALISLQTMQGFLGAGNYGIARMNGGFASRPGFAVGPGLGWAERFRRDIGVWMEIRPRLVNDYGYKNKKGVALLWIEPWDGTASRSLPECDPFFIEICRRVRMICCGERLCARFGTTDSAFLDSKDRHGNTGDIWTPVSVDGKALTIGAGGLSYRTMTEVLFKGNYPQRPALQVRQEDGKEPVVVAQVLARGQGKTDRYRERVLPVPPKARSKLLKDDGVDELREFARQRIVRTDTAAKKVLRPALCALLQGGRDDLDLRDSRADQWIANFDEAVDRFFFDELWDSLALDREEADMRWDRRLTALARNHLDDAITSVSSSAARWPRTIARAELIFRGASRKHLPGAYSKNEGKEARDE